MIARRSKIIAEIHIIIKGKLELPQSKLSCYYDKNVLLIVAQHDTYKI